MFSPLRGEVREGHDRELVPARETGYVVIVIVAFGTPAEFVVRKEVNRLSENGLPLKHFHPG
jgi:hypothetical protein